MIVHRMEFQALECTVCGEVEELMRKTYRDQEALMIKRQAMEHEHKPCEEFVGDPDRAKAERVFLAGMRREMQPQRKGRR